MIAEEENDRPTMEEVKEFFYGLNENYLTDPFTIVAKGLLYANENEY